MLKVAIDRVAHLDPSLAFADFYLPRIAETIVWILSSKTFPQAQDNQFFEDLNAAPKKMSGCQHAAEAGRFEMSRKRKREQRSASRRELRNSPNDDPSFLCREFCGSRIHARSGWLQRAAAQWLSVALRGRSSGCWVHDGFQQAAPDRRNNAHLVLHTIWNVDLSSEKKESPKRQIQSTNREDCRFFLESGENDQSNH